VPLRFSANVNRLRAELRGKHGPEQLAILSRAIEQLPVAALVADNSARYVAANIHAENLTGYTGTELLSMSVGDLAVMPAEELLEDRWGRFIGRGAQRGEYDVRRKNGSTIRIRYWAFASIAPGLHLSLLQPV